MHPLVETSGADDATALFGLAPLPPPFALHQTRPDRAGQKLSNAARAGAAWLVSPMGVLPVQLTPSAEEHTRTLLLSLSATNATQSLPPNVARDGESWAAWPMAA